MHRPGRMACPGALLQLQQSIMTAGVPHTWLDMLCSGARAGRDRKRGDAGGGRAAGGGAAHGAPAQPAGGRGQRHHRPWRRADSRAARLRAGRISPCGVGDRGTTPCRRGRGCAAAPAQAASRPRAHAARQLLMWRLTGVAAAVEEGRSRAWGACVVGRGAAVRTLDLGEVTCAGGCDGQLSHLLVCGNAPAARVYCR